MRKKRQHAEKEEKESELINYLNDIYKELFDKLYIFLSFYIFVGEVGEWVWVCLACYLSTTERLWTMSCRTAVSVWPSPHSSPNKCFCPFFLLLCYNLYSAFFLLPDFLLKCTHHHHSNNLKIYIHIYINKIYWAVGKYSIWREKSPSFMMWFILCVLEMEFEGFATGLKEHLWQLRFS